MRHTTKEHWIPRPDWGDTIDCYRSGGQIIVYNEL